MSRYKNPQVSKFVILCITGSFLLLAFLLLFLPFKSTFAQPSVSPFLYQPFTGTYPINSYFDHKFPSQQSDSYPNVVIYTGDEKPSCSDIGQPGTYCYNGHEGWDYGLPHSTQVLAAAAGNAWSQWYDPNDSKKGYGYYVRIDHDGSGTGFRTIYGHLLPAYSLVPGVHVQRGDAIGLSGNTGNVSGPTGDHLHFGVCPLNQPNTPNDCWGYVVDPYGWFGSNRDPLYDYNQLVSQWLWADKSPSCTAAAAGVYREELSDTCLPPTPTSPSVPTTEGVRLCQDVNYNGCTRFVADAPSLGATGVGNDQADSIAIDGDWSAVLYQDDNYGGAHAAFDGSDPDLMDNNVHRNDASSMRVRRRNPWLVTLYENNNYNGQPFASDRAISDLSHWNFNDMASSVRVASGYCVRLYEDANFGGNSMDVCADRTEVGGSDNRFSSFQICSGACPTPTPANTPTLTVTPTPTQTPTPEPICAPVNDSIFGNGTNCALTVSGTYYVDTIRTALASNAAAGQKTLSISNATGFAANQEVLVIQMQGSTAGAYEFGIVSSVGSGTLTLANNLANAYSQGGNTAAQVIRVPHYTNVTIPTDSVLTAHAWDGSTGGVVAFRANGLLTIAAGGVMTANGIGYRGAPQNTSTSGTQGESYGGLGTQNCAANGGGGGGGGSYGYGDPPAGGGGGHGMPGLAGGPGHGHGNPCLGIGGVDNGSSDLSVVRPGSGGGSGGNDGSAPEIGGAGGNGGGIILVYVNSVAVAGAISADGNNGGNGVGTGGANGGAGAGGSILLVSASANVGNDLVVARGGVGARYGSGSDQNGGDGGTGRIRVQYFNSFAGSTNPVASVYQYPAPPPTNTPTSTPVPTNTATPTPTATVVSGGLELLAQPWHLVGNNGAAELYQSIPATALQGKNMLRITYNLHGLMALGSDASAIIFDQNGWQYISLANYGQNGRDGVQTVDLPLSQFAGLNPNANVGTLHTRFWYSGPFVVDITSIVAYSSQGPIATPTMTATNTPIPPPTFTPTKTPVSTASATPTPTAMPTAASGVELLTQPWHLAGNNGAVEKYQTIAPTMLQSKNTIRLTYNLHGLRALGGDASAIIFDQNGWRYISLSNYGQNGLDGLQTVDIPLSAFPGLNLNANVGTLHTRFWYSGPFVVDITSIMVYAKVAAASTEEMANGNSSHDINSVYLPLIRQ